MNPHIPADVPHHPEDCCATCGSLLPLVNPPYSWHDQGFCGLTCAMRCAGGYLLMGAPAIAMAELPGPKGPGFERDLVRDWLAKATPTAPAMLGRFTGDASGHGDRGHVFYGLDCWVWRLYAGGAVQFVRFTPKEGARR